MQNNEDYESIDLNGQKGGPSSHGQEKSTSAELKSQGEITHEVLSQEQIDSSTKQRYGFRVWATIVALSFTQLLTALEGTVVSTALPTIVADLGGSSDYIWVSSGYFLTSVSRLRLLYNLPSSLLDTFNGSVRDPQEIEKKLTYKNLRRCASHFLGRWPIYSDEKALSYSPS